jgi:hypothetical protein
MATAAEIARLLARIVEREGSLEHDAAAGRIWMEFGDEADEFLIRSPYNNWKIHPDVLAEFRNLTGDSVVWSNGRRAWRQREESDRPGRSQD